jgi:glutamine synthetase
VAGCLELLPHCMPIFSPNHNAFRRLGGTVNAATRASWGFEDRDACVRIPESDPRNLRIEHRLASADANPYLVLAAILVGLEHGLEAKREPIAAERRPHQRRRLPLDMLDACAPCNITR